MPRILLLEEEEALRTQLRQLLEGSGFAVELATSGLDGIVRALRSPPDLVLTDVHLSDLEGSEVTARLRQERSLAGVPIVAMGGLDRRAAALAAGADCFMARAAAEALPGRLRELLAGERERLSPERELEALRALVGAMAARLEAAIAGQGDAALHLAEADKLRTAFVHNLAHELSTPLTPLAGYLRILQSEKTGPLTAQQKRMTESMTSSVARLSRILENLSDFANLQAGQAPLVESTVKPDQLAEEVAAEQRVAVRDARLHLQVMPSGAPELVADARKLRQALANLVSNAVKFSPHGGEVLVEVALDGDRLRYAVYDQGPGVPPEDQPRIFEPLHHAASRYGEEARPPGSGLGLPVARRIAEAHGGRVLVESPPRTQPRSSPRHFTGSRFSLEIPARLAPSAGGAGTGALPG
jgi:signal transduction histidine kinase